LSISTQLKSEKEYYLYKTAKKAEKKEKQPRKIGCFKVVFRIFLLFCARK
jgi:hypothetical protein